MLVLSGAGVGGGSLVYANTLYEPLAAFYDDPQWRDITDWRAELAPHYDQAKRMLGVTTYPVDTGADRAMRAVAERMGVGHTFHATPVGVYIGRPGQRVADPYFGGAGPERTGCLHCGACMTGCRHGAKNTLVKNYLWLAERLGAQVHPLTTVTAVRPGRRRRVRGATPSAPAPGCARRRQVIHADQVVFAAGALGTQRLLHAMRADRGAARALRPARRADPDQLGGDPRRLGARRRARPSGLDFTEGVAITSSFHPDPQTHIEPVRYGRGSNAMGLLQSLLVDGGPHRVRALAGQHRCGSPVTAARMLSVRGWSRADGDRPGHAVGWTTR